MTDIPKTYPSGSMIAAVFAAIGATACCAGPLILLMLGISGSWIGNLSSLQPYRPIFIIITLLFLGMAFRKLYLIPAKCDVNAACATTTALRNQRILFWVVSFLVVLIASFPWYGPIILD